MGRFYHSIYLLSFFLPVVLYPQTLFILYVHSGGDRSFFWAFNIYSTMFLPFFLSLCLCLFLSFLHQAVALTLQPLASEHFEEHPKVIKRDWNGTEEIDPSRLDLQDVESFYWGGNGGDSLLFANLTGSIRHPNLTPPMLTALDSLFQR